MLYVLILSPDVNSVQFFCIIRMCFVESLYNYEVKNLNRQVKRNTRRVPEDFMIKPTRDEVDSLVKCQIVTS